MSPSCVTTACRAAPPVEAAHLDVHGPDVDAEGRIRAQIRPVGRRLACRRPRGGRAVRDQRAGGSTGSVVITLRRRLQLGVRSRSPGDTSAAPRSRAGSSERGRGRGARAPAGAGRSPRTWGWSEEERGTAAARRARRTASRGDGPGVRAADTRSASGGSGRGPCQSVPSPGGRQLLADERLVPLQVLLHRPAPGRDWDAPTRLTWKPVICSATKFMSARRPAWSASAAVEVAHRAAAGRSPRRPTPPDALSAASTRAGTPSATWLAQTRDCAFSSASSLFARRPRQRHGRLDLRHRRRELEGDVLLPDQLGAERDLRRPRPGTAPRAPRPARRHRRAASTSSAMSLVEAALAPDVLAHAEDADDVLLDLRRALVDRQDARVAADLLHLEVHAVAVAAEGLHGVVGRDVAGLGGEQLRDRALDLAVRRSRCRAGRRRTRCRPARRRAGRCSARAACA